MVIISTSIILKIHVYFRLWYCSKYRTVYLCSAKCYLLIFSELYNGHDLTWPCSYLMGLVSTMLYYTSNSHISHTQSVQDIVKIPYILGQVNRLFLKTNWKGHPLMCKLYIMNFCRLSTFPYSSNVNTQHLQIRTCKHTRYFS